MKDTSPSAAGVRMRPLAEADIAPLRDALAQGEVAATTRRLFPRSLPSLLDWYDHLSGAKEASPFALLAGERLIGFCSLRAPIYSGRELAIAIFDPRYHDRGVGTFAVRELCRYGFESLKLPRIELGVYPANRRAIACYLRCGFRDEALLRRFIYHEGAWVDIMLMSLLRAEWGGRR